MIKLIFIRLITKYLSVKIVLLISNFQILNLLLNFNDYFSFIILLSHSTVVAFPSRKALECRDIISITAALNES